MSVVAVGSVRGAPGVTTTSLLLAAALEGGVLVEADLNGGVVAVRYGLGREPGLTTLAAERPTHPEGWKAHAQLAGGVPVLVGPDGAAGAVALWRGAGERLEVVLRRADAAVVVDLGRLGDSPPLLGIVDLALVLVRPVAEHLVALSHRLAALRSGVCRADIAVVLVGNGPYGAADLEPWGVEVIASLPDDRRAAAALAEGGWSTLIRRSSLARHVLDLGSEVAARVEPMGAVQ